jgi:hypothetical protein
MLHEDIRDAGFDVNPLVGVLQETGVQLSRILVSESDEFILRIHTSARTAAAAAAAAAGNK